MKRHHQPSGLQRGLDLFIDPHWAADQALAVIEVLDDLRDRIWTHYEIALLDRLSAERVTDHNVEISDLPF